MEGTNVIRNYKDTIFRLLFTEKRQLLSLYNAINETDYQNEVREYLKQYPLEKAVFMAVDECINTGILENFLRDNKSEVIHMSIYEYDEELHEQTLLEEGRKEGREEMQQELQPLIDAKDKAINERDKALDEKNRELNEKDAEIIRLRELLAKK